MFYNSNKHTTDLDIKTLKDKSVWSLNADGELCAKLQISEQKDVEQAAKRLGIEKKSSSNFGPYNIAEEISHLFNDKNIYIYKDAETVPFVQQDAYKEFAKRQNSINM